MLPSSSVINKIKKNVQGLVNIKSRTVSQKIIQYNVSTVHSGTGLLCNAVLALDVLLVLPSP